MAHDMVDYEYYANAYLGSLIPPQEFSYQAKRAESYLRQGDREEEGRRLYRAAGVYLDIYRGRCADESH